MSVLSVQTKKIPELQATTGLVGSDMIIVELADGGWHGPLLPDCEVLQG